MSESATERLHEFVREVAERHLDGTRHVRSLQRTLEHIARSAGSRDQFERTLTGLIGSEVTAAYVFGLAVGLTLPSLSERLNGLRD